MELNIPNPDALNMPDAFGIPDERLIELEDGLRKLWDSVGRDHVKMRWHHLAAEIAALCNTKEELFHCCVVQCGMLQIAGRRII